MVAFISIVYFVMTNMLLAIIMQAYNETLVKSGDMPMMWTQFRHYMYELLLRGSLVDILWRKRDTCMGCKHSELLNGLDQLAPKDDAGTLRSKRLSSRDSPGLHSQRPIWLTSDPAAPGPLHMLGESARVVDESELASHFPQLQHTAARKLVRDSLVLNQTNLQSVLKLDPCSALSRVHDLSRDFEFMLQRFERGTGALAAPGLYPSFLVLYGCRANMVLVLYGCRTTWCWCCMAAGP